MEIKSGTTAPCVVEDNGIVIFAGTHTACQRFVDEQRGAAVRFGFAWQSGRTENSARYTKNNIVLARYWFNENLQHWQIAVLLPIIGGFPSTFLDERQARNAIEKHVSDWFEQVSA